MVRGSIKLLSLGILFVLVTVGCGQRDTGGGTEGPPDEASKGKTGGVETTISGPASGADGSQEATVGSSPETGQQAPGGMAHGGLGMATGTIMGHARAAPPKGPAPLTVQFLGDATGDIASTRWEFGDGSGADEPEPRHTYQEPGVYRATFTTTGKDGWVDQASVKVTVLPPSGKELVGWPSVRLTSPGRDHQNLRGTVEVAVEASQNVAKVEYYLGAKPLRTETAAPFAWKWDTRKERSTMYYLTAVAYDAQGRIDVSDVMVSIGN